MTVSNPDRRAVWYQLQVGSKLEKQIYGWSDRQDAIRDAQALANKRYRTVAVVQFITAETPGNKPNRTVVQQVRPQR